MKPKKTPLTSFHTDYLQRIINAKVYDVAKESALEVAERISKGIKNTLLLKREDQQQVFSFKLRGAYNKMANLSPSELLKGVICASAGNHAQGVALSANKLNCKALVVMPLTTPALKIDAVKALGAEVLLHGDSYTDAHEYAIKLSQQKGLTFVHPFDDPDVIAGQGTIAAEILRQHQGPLHAVFVAIGGGGLISGVASYIKAVRPEIKVIGVQMMDSDAMLQSIKEKKRINLKDVGLFSDATAVKLVGRETYRLTKSFVDDYICVDTDAVCAAIKDVFIDTRSIVEPAGAMAVAAAKAYAKKHNKKGETYAAILCGANINFDRLRFVAERAAVGEEREALFAVTIPEERGSFKRFCSLISELPHPNHEDLNSLFTEKNQLTPHIRNFKNQQTPRQVTEFNYRMNDSKEAHVFLGLSTTTKGESSLITKALNKNGFKAIDLTHDELSKEHVRHMVGGPSDLAVDERLLRFVFPERPGALMKFLSALAPEWNISLFHYRNQGADYGKILVGLQVPPKDQKALGNFLNKQGYSFVDETHNPAFKLFMKRS
jgi:threonine dehydratase